MYDRTSLVQLCNILGCTQVCCSNVSDVTGVVYNYESIINLVIIINCN